MARRNHYHVYVIELSKDVLFEGRFKKANPDYDYAKPCVWMNRVGPAQLLKLIGFIVKLNA